MPTPPPGQLFSTFQIGTWNPATDTWTLLYDLNQPVTGPVFIMAKFPQWAPGEKYDSKSTTIRAVGERIVETNLKNGHWKVKLTIRGASTAAIAATIRTIAQALEQPQLCIRYSAPEATQYLYFDVRKVTHNLHQATAQQLIAGVQSGLIDFECFPLARGDRQYLQNLIYNPGFDALSGAPVLVFSDNFATTNAYTTISGSPGLSANTLSIPNGGLMIFGSPVWGAINSWQVRFQFSTGLAANFYLHYVDANDWVRLVITSTTYTVQQNVASTISTISTGSIGTTLVNNNFYWVSLTQFPSTLAVSPYVGGGILNDNAGAPGTTNTTIPYTALANAQVAVEGKCGFGAQNVTMNIGGESSPTNLVSIFGPGAWQFPVFSGIAAGAWDTSLGDSSGRAPTTYPNGPVNSYGAARIDAPIAGAWSVGWTNYNGGTLLGSYALPVLTPTHTMYASAWCKSSGLGVSATIALVVRQWTAAAALISTTTLQTLTGNQASWTQLSGNVVTAANCAFIDVGCNTGDATAGSAGGTVWFDNVLCWDSNIAGTTSMPYCELRFPQSPAQLVVSGILGDQPAPVLLAFGTFVSSLTTGQLLQFGIGRKATTGVNARLVSGPVPVVGTTGITPTLSTTAYGGAYIAKNGITNAVITPTVGIIIPMPDTQGLFHLIVLQQTAASTVTQIVVQYTSGQLDPGSTNAKGLSTILGPSLSPFTQQSVWQPLDLGTLAIPNYPLVSAGSQNTFPWGAWVGIDDLLGTAAELVGWYLLLPYDAETLLGQVVNQSGYTNLTNEWIWLFSDALTLSQRTMYPQSWQLQAIGTSQNVPNIALAQTAYAVGGPGSSAGSFMAINPAGSPFLRVDPTQTTPNSNGLGVNQFGAFFTDNNGTVLPWTCDIQYSPYYYYQR